ncbi:MAG: hypothetical protein JNL82_10805 [Myxococcales bacterium]|nr:hypothetical protein [Myxococcales bacterium]
MYTLYSSPGSASMLVHLLLLEIGAEHRLARVDLAGRIKARASRRRYEIEGLSARA